MSSALERTIAQLTKTLVENLQDEIESIILYGSVARGEANENSDIDILIITRRGNRELYNKISKIRTKIDLENNTLTTLIQMSKNEIEKYMRFNSPFIENILKEGVTLYDRGLLNKLRKSITLEG